ncbi:MAG TPA: DUF1990 family protein, partial [Rubrobacteraceae bacterium]|nr:DUF1990 family protein [Rubrobacteraceae bacterium]
MFLLKEPAEDDVRRFIDSQKGLPFSYREVGASREDMAPPGYSADRYRVKLGEGKEAYTRAI